MGRQESQHLQPVALQMEENSHLQHMTSNNAVTHKFNCYNFSDTLHNNFIMPNNPRANEATKNLIAISTQKANK